MGTSTVDYTLADYRGSGAKRPIWMATIDQMSWIDDNTDTISSTVPINGIIKRIKATYSAGDGDPDLTLLITDLDGNTISTTGAKDDNQTVIWDADGTDFSENQLAFFDGFIVSVTSEDPGASGVTADVEIIGI